VILRACTASCCAGRREYKSSDGASTVLLAATCCAGATAARAQVRARAEGLAAALPLAAALASGALRLRHREALAAAAGCDLRPDEPGCTLRRLLEAGAVARQQARSALNQTGVAALQGQAAL
jgi:hypothetical protein